MRSTYVVHYSEVALKGRNRPEFLRALRRNLVRSLWGLEPDAVLKDGRFVVSVNGDEGQAARRLGGQFGVSWFARAEVVGLEYEAILSEVLKLARETPGGSFKIQARRSDKSFHLTSQEIATRLGAAVAEETGKSVNLSSPALVLHVDITRGGAMVYSDWSRGLGGLPVGTAGRVVHLFSGGIDSPVAAWLMMKRGCVPVYLHFYLAPTQASVADSKVVGLVRILSTYSGRSTIVLAPFARYQLATSGAPSELEPVLFRRFMRMSAEELASRLGASGISTGDSLSQAASQTIWNIAAQDQGSAFPILRPLLAYDKEEIVGLAKRIGTYDLSLEEYKDCCAIVTRHPRTRVKAETIDEFAEKLRFKELVSEVLEEATLLTFTPSRGTTKTSPLPGTKASSGARGVAPERALAEADL